MTDEKTEENKAADVPANEPQAKAPVPLGRLPLVRSVAFGMDGNDLARALVVDDDGCVFVAKPVLDLLLRIERKVDDALAELRAAKGGK